MKKLIALLMFFILFASCASVSTQSKKVRVTSKPDMIEGCEYKGQVGSSSILADIRVHGVVFNNAIHEMKGEANKIGANVVLIPTRADTTGEAYKCNSI